jgi:LPXTG-motif cell wall-anchored protein
LIHWLILPLAFVNVLPANGSGSSTDEWLLAGAIVLGGAVFFLSKGKNKK